MRLAASALESVDDELQRLLGGTGAHHLRVALEHQPVRSGVPVDVHADSTPTQTVPAG